MQTEQSMPNLRRWCRECGLPSPIGEPSCAHCGESPNRVGRGMLPILNEGNGTVQNTVLNFDAADLIDALSDDEPVQHHPSFFHRFFMVTCSIALWCGILTVGSCMLAIITFVVLAVMKAHG